jgi:hypothetical protein
MTISILGLRNFPQSAGSATWSSLSQNTTGADLLLPLGQSTLFTNVSQNFINWKSSMGISLAGHLTVSSGVSNQVRMMDVTDYAKSVIQSGGSSLTFVLYRPFRRQSYRSAAELIQPDDLAQGSYIRISSIYTTSCLAVPQIIHFA